MSWFESLQMRQVQDGNLRTAWLAEFRSLLVMDAAGGLDETDELRIMELTDSLGLSLAEITADRDLAQQARRLSELAAEIDNRRAELEQARQIHGNALETVDLEIRRLQSSTRGRTSVSVSEANEALAYIERLRSGRSTKSAELDVAVRQAEFRVNESQQAGREFQSLVQKNSWLIQQPELVSA